MAGVPASSHGSGGAASGLTKLFATTLGASGIAAGHGTLLIYILAQSALAGVSEAFTVRVNGDSGANYDAAYMGVTAGTTAAQGTQLAQTAWGALGLVHGSTGTDNYPSA